MYFDGLICRPSGAGMRIVGPPPCGDGTALRKYKGELGFRILARFFSHCTKLHSVALNSKNPRLSVRAVFSPGPRLPRRALEAMVDEVRFRDLRFEAWCLRFDV